MLTGDVPTREFYDGLTAREVEVLKMIASGMPNKRIARALEISPETVKSHVKRIFIDLALKNERKP